jgi:hypothetical protein
VSVLAMGAQRVEDPHVSSYEYVAAPRSVNVLPTSVARRLTRRDGLLPLILALELVVGVAFGLASHSGDGEATSVPAKLTLGAAPVVTVLPSTQPVAHVVAGTTQAQAVTVGPVVPQPSGPAVGPLLPGTVRIVSVEVAPVTAVRAEPAPKPVVRHAPRDPFASLVTAP